MSWVTMEEQEIVLCRFRTAALEVSKEMYSQVASTMGEGHT